ncbi:MAG TPA: hypothetical protein VLV83_04880 [Acidobacteriota bacterium]|nr:hypothetical protein [Acidobacteriota bacterium]
MSAITPVFLFCFGLLAGTSLPHTYLGADKQPLPFSEEEILDALRTGRIVSKRRVGEGINNPFKVLLEKDGVRLHALFRDVRVFKPRHEDPEGRVTIHFRDDCIFELAAYRLARRVGIDSVPPVVRRRLGRREGTLQLWIEDAIMNKTRHRQSLRPKLDLSWRLQWNTLYIFDYLIANDDRNQGNLLFDPQWKLWMIDHTRAFRFMADRNDVARIRLCDEELYDALKRLDEPALKETLGDFMGDMEIEAVNNRLAHLLQHLDGLIESRGPQMVLR